MTSCMSYKHLAKCLKQISTSVNNAALWQLLLPLHTLLPSAFFCISSFFFCFFFCFYPFSSFSSSFSLLLLLLFFFSNLPYPPPHLQEREYHFPQLFEHVLCVSPLPWPSALNAQPHQFPFPLGSDKIASLSLSHSI